MVRRLAVFLAAIALALTINSPADAGPPRVRENTRFDADSPFALVVFEVEPQAIVPEWSLELYAFDLETRAWTYGILRGWSDFGGIETNSQRRFVVGLVRPDGVYAVNRIAVQGLWRACMNGGTKAFQLQAGRVNYIGVIDPTPTLREITERLPAVTANYQVLNLFDTPRLAYMPAAERANWQADVAAYLVANHPRVNAEIVAPEPIDTTFEPGHSSIAGKICEKY